MKYLYQNFEKDLNDVYENKLSTSDFHEDYKDFARWGYNYALQSKIVTDLANAAKSVGHWITTYGLRDTHPIAILHQALQNYESQIKKMGETK